MTQEVGMTGYPPIVKVGPPNPEMTKYHKLYQLAEYRKGSPGEQLTQVFLDKAKPAKGAEILDCGCGTGRGSLMLAKLGGLKVTAIDFVDNAMDPEIMRGGLVKWLKWDLENPLPINAEYAYAGDFMEHIPAKRVDAVLNNILQAANKCWFSIALFDDPHGVKLIGEPLHITLRPFEWWEEKFKERDCKILYSHNQDNIYAHFFVEAWVSGETVVEHGSLNTEEKIILDNVRHNTRKVWMLGKDGEDDRGPFETEDLALSQMSQGWTPKERHKWMQVRPYLENDIECMILGGGPSLNDFVDEIKQNRADGVKLITLNGAYNWASAHGLTPSAQIVVDARPFNARFTKPVVEDCKYLIASQVDPSVLEGLPEERTFLWHTMSELLKDILDTRYGEGGWWSIPGGSTILLRAIPLMRMLGYRKFILYGCDSCLMDSKHHSYAQPENDRTLIIPVIAKPSGRIFQCHAWMVSQAEEFIQLVKFIGDEIDLDVKGDGLLAHIVKTGAEQAELEKVE